MFPLPTEAVRGRGCESVTVEASTEDSLPTGLSGVYERGYHISWYLLLLSKDDIAKVVMQV